MGEEHFYCSVIQNGSYTLPIDRLFEENPPKLKLDNFYFDIISKALDDEGIYISLAYCNGEMRVSKDSVDEVIEYDDYDLGEDEYEYLVEYGLISSYAVKKFKVYAEEGISAPGRTEDVGLMINIFDGNYNAYFALRSTDRCMSSFKVLPFSKDYPKEHPLSFKNPINKILIGMIDKAIVLK